MTIENRGRTPDTQLGQKPAENTEPGIIADPTITRLRNFVKTDDLSNITRSMAATYALNAIGHAERTGVFNPKVSEIVQTEVPTGWPDVRINKTPKPELVATEIYKRIANGEIDDRLPSETDLVNLSGISRQGVREGLTMLEVGGVIVTQRGNGTFVTNRENIPNIKPPISEVPEDGIVFYPKNATT